MDNLFSDKDKLKAIIDNLQSQFSQGASAEKLLESAHLLIAELQQNKSQAKEKKNIAVVMPVNYPVMPVQEKLIINESPEEDVAPEMPEPIVENLVPEAAVEEEETIIENKEIEEPESIAEQEPVNNNAIPTADTWNIFNDNAAPPTLAYYDNDNIKELNENFSSQSNDFIASIQHTPIRDLTAAVGINDRYVFINELFRGDEFMYERSIITLNKFHSYEQAEGWIERELKLKLGWDTNNVVTRQFEQLIQRRFR